jgi:hypothetical protein
MAKSSHSEKEQYDEKEAKARFGAALKGAP